MKTLSLRMQAEHDEQLKTLCQVWGLNPSDAVRRAIRETAQRVETKQKSKIQILRERGLLGGYSDSSDKSPKQRFRDSLQEKYGP